VAKLSIGSVASFLGIFQPHHGKNKLIFNEMMRMSALY